MASRCNSPEMSLLQAEKSEKALENSRKSCSESDGVLVCLVASSPSRRSITESVRFWDKWSDLNKVDRIVLMDRPNGRWVLEKDGGGGGV